MEGDHWAFMSPYVMEKWIVRERSAEPHFCFDSSISLFIFPHMVRQACQIYAPMCVLVYLISRSNACNACSLNSIAYVCVGAIPVRFKCKFSNYEVMSKRGFYL